MSPALVSLVALLIAIVLSFTSRINVGLLAMAFAWAIGVFLLGWKADAVIAGFPTPLFVTLIGVTLLFALAQSNRTMDAVAQRAVRLCRGNAGLIPLAFFALALVVSSVGPGAIASVALLAPMAMAVGERAAVPTFLMAIMVGNGANAGNLSPFSAVGAVANAIMAQYGLGGQEGAVWGANLAAHAFVSAIAYVAFGGWTLLRRGRTADATVVVPPPLERRHWLTLGVIGLWIAVVVVFQLHVGLAAIAAASVIVLARSADETEGVKGMPWTVILMVTGVTTLIAVMEKTGGLDLFTTMLARLASPSTVTGVIAFVTGLISTYSSTSGVVLPTFLPTVPGLVQKLGGGDPLAIALSINVGSSLVDVSPLSTLGALCIAAVSSPEEGRLLFRRLLIWGLCMSVVGALFCYFFIGLFAR